MTDEDALAIWNTQTLRLMRALIGAVSPNFRIVVLDAQEDRWILRFVLEAEDAEDRDEIEDVAAQFDAFQEGYIERDVEVAVTAAPLTLPAFPARTIYRRREG